MGPKAQSKVSLSLVASRSFPTEVPQKCSSVSSRWICPELGWHKASIDEMLQGLAVGRKTGLKAAQVQRRAAHFGANRISASRTLRKVVGWVFGGFGNLLLAASVVSFIAW